MIGPYPVDEPPKPKVRVLVRNVAENRCQADGLHAPGCPGVGASLHHIVPRRWGGDTCLQNSLWVAIKCHRIIHANEDTAVLLGLMKYPPKIIPDGSFS